MKAVVLPRFGAPDVLSYREIPRPVPSAGEVLVRVRAVSVNRGFDVVARAGGSPFNLQLPLILGVDPTGHIVEVGTGVDRSRIGQLVNLSGVTTCRQCQGCKDKQPCTVAKRIGVTSPGGYAEYIAVPAFQARTLPAGLDPAEATVICRHAGAAYSEIHTADLHEGEWVLIMGAAGALGSFLIQLARAKGARVIVAASTQERIDACLALGAHYGVVYKNDSLSDRVMDITSGHGADAVFENIGDPILFPSAFDSLAMGGRLVTIGYHGGGIVPLDVKKLHMRRLRVLSSAMGGGAVDVWEECLRLASEGKIKSLIAARMPLAEAAKAHQLVEENKLIGKIILEP